MREETRHWSDDELLRRVYGVAGEGAVSEAHLEHCAECGARWQQLLSRRAATLGLAAEGSVSEERLQRQRQAVWARIERRPGVWFRKWAPAAAAACMLAAGIFLLHPPGLLPAPRPFHVSNAPAQISDAQLFNDVAVLSSPEAPRAAAPIRGLFEERRETQEEVVF
jgi:hypothetical protein